MSQRLIAPSILNSDFLNLGKEIEMLNSSQADYVHIDIMDGVFVPNISFGFPVTQAVARQSKKPLDFHLMVIDPNPYLVACKESGAEIITVHLETCHHLNRTISAIRELGVKAGVAINPHTNVQLLEDILPRIDLALIMSVNPGFGGQQFIEQTFVKIGKLRRLANELNPDLLIEVDGGINLKNARQIYDAGADMLVVGNTIFSSDIPLSVIEKIKTA